MLFLVEAEEGSTRGGQHILPSFGAQMSLSYITMTYSVLDE